MLIPSYVQIENGEKFDMFDKWGFIYVSAPPRFAAPETKRDTTSYAEQSGANVDPRTVDSEFDYKVKFVISAPNRNLVNANSKIKAWNEAVREREAGSDVKRCKTITFYDVRNRNKITGIPEVIETVDEKDFYRKVDGSLLDCVEIELVIHVNDPKACDFDLVTD